MTVDSCCLCRRHLTSNPPVGKAVMYSNRQVIGYNIPPFPHLFSFADTGNLHKVKKALSHINTKSFVSYNSGVYTFLAGIRPLSILPNILQVALFCSFSASE